MNELRLIPAFESRIPVSMNIGRRRSVDQIDGTVGQSNGGVIDGFVIGIKDPSSIGTVAAKDILKINDLRNSYEQQPEQNRRSSQTRQGRRLALKDCVLHYRGPGRRQVTEQPLQRWYR